jgi:NhaA family Na+:H+ antiporter
MKALRFLTTDAGSGLLLALAAALAVIAANSPLSGAYNALVTLPLSAPWLGAHSLADWVKEVPMAVFFFAVGLEIKHELRHGGLADARTAMLPVAAALGGMVVPALVYLAINAGGGGHANGWPIPVATDIAFALAALAIAAPRAPPALRLFLLTLAVVDDLGAVAIIALLFSHGAAGGPLVGAIVVLAAVALLGRWRKAPAWLYALALAVVIALLMKAHVSTSLAGVAVAFLVPDTRLHRFQTALAPWSALLILPLFAFTAAGVSLASLSGGALLAPVSLGTAAGLLLGKPLGVVAAAALAVRLKIAAKPADLSWGALAGAGLLCGVGFTMSLYLAALSFPQIAFLEQAKAGVLVGSLASIAAGIVALRLQARRES